MKGQRRLLRSDELLAHGLAAGFFFPIIFMLERVAAQLLPEKVGQPLFFPSLVSRVFDLMCLLFVCAGSVIIFGWWFRNWEEEGSYDEELLKAGFVAWLAFVTGVIMLSCELHGIAVMAGILGLIVPPIFLIYFGLRRWHEFSGYLRLPWMFMGMITATLVLCDIGSKVKMAME